MTESFSFANNFWGKDETGVHNLIQRMHDAKQTCEEVHAFFKERVAIEEEYSRRMTALSRRALGSAETGTLKDALSVIRSTTESMARSHGTAAIQIKQQLDDPLESFAASLRQRRKTTESTVEKLHKAKLSQNAAVEKARTKFEQDCNKINGYFAQQNLLLGKELEKNNMKLDKVHMSIDNTKREYQNSLRVLAETIDRWNKEWKQSCDKFQDLEEERINFLKSNLWAYTNIVSTVCVADDEGCETIRVGLEKCDVEQDIVEFVRAKGTGSEILDPPEFINFLDGYSRDTVPNQFRVANFARGDNGAEEAEDVSSTHDHKANSCASHVYEQSQPTSAFEVPISQPTTIDNRDSMSTFSVPALSYPSECERSAQSSPVHDMTSPNSSVYSNNTSISSQSNLSSSEHEDHQQQAVEKKRSWASPFRRRSKKDLSKGWGSFSSSRNNSPASSAGPVNSPLSINTEQDSTITAKSGLGKQFMQVSPSKSHLSSRPASVLSMGENMFDLGVSPTKSTPFESRSSSPKKQLSKDDPLVAALERLKISSVSPKPGAESQPKSASSTSLAAPEPAFTAAEMESTQKKYTSQTREMFDFADERIQQRQRQQQQQPQQQHASPQMLHRPVSTVDLRAPRSPSPAPQQQYATTRERPKSAYFAEPQQPLNFDPYHHQRSKSASPVKQYDHNRSSSPSPYGDGYQRQDQYDYQGYENPRARNQYDNMPQGQNQQRTRSSMQQYEQEPARPKSSMQQQYDEEPIRVRSSQGYDDQPQQQRPRSRSNVDKRVKLQPNHLELPRTARDGRPVIRYSKAAYDYRAAIPEEVSFRKGDILLVLRMQEDGWWEVEVMGSRARTGLAPSNFLVNA